MKRTSKQKSKAKPDFNTMPFVELVERDERLAAIRAAQASRTPEQRKKAAEWSYDSWIAADMVGKAFAGAGGESPFPEHWPAGVEALAIDPKYAPALLTVGSMEYQLGREDEAMALFRSLLTLPNDTEDLIEIIDKAGTFLAQDGDPELAWSFYEAACLAFPENSVLLAGLSYSLCQLQRLDEAIAMQRRAVALEPRNAKFLNDLGWVLAENGECAEAEKVLKKAVALSPPEYDLARNNLSDLRKRMKPGKSS